MEIEICTHGRETERKINRSLYLAVTSSHMYAGHRDWWSSDEEQAVDSGPAENTGVLAEAAAGAGVPATDPGLVPAPYPPASDGQGHKNGPREGPSEGPREGLGGAAGGQAMLGTDILMVLMMAARTAAVQETDVTVTQVLSAWGWTSTGSWAARGAVGDMAGGVAGGPEFHVSITTASCGSGSLTQHSQLDVMRCG